MVNKLPADVRGLVMSIITHIDVCVSHLLVSVQDDWTWKSILDNGKEYFKKYVWLQIYLLSLILLNTDFSSVHVGDDEHFGGCSFSDPCGSTGGGGTASDLTGDACSRLPSDHARNWGYIFHKSFWGIILELAWSIIKIVLHNSNIPHLPVSLHSCLIIWKWCFMLKSKKSQVLFWCIFKTRSLQTSYI